jgi:hypothetical protein
VTRHAAPRRETPTVVATLVTGLAVIVSGVAVVLTAHVPVRTNAPERPAITSSARQTKVPAP